MKTTGISIGNYLNYGGSIAVLNEKEIVHFTRFPENYEPIALTKEWLLSFGFECYNKISMVFKKYHNDINADYSLLILKEVGNNPIWVYSAFNRWTINPFTKEIKYVHELQKLYFSPTDEELKEIQPIHP